MPDPARRSRPPVTSSRGVEPIPIGAIVAVAIGGAAGTAVRHGALTADWRPAVIVLTVNVVGSFLLGLIVAAGRRGLTDRWSALAGIGFCGGLTTFSTHALDVAQRLDDQQWSSALASVSATTMLCVAAAGAGHRMAHRSGAGQP